MKTYIAGRDWSGIFSGTLILEPVESGDVAILDDCGPAKFYSGDQRIDLTPDSNLFHTIEFQCTVDPETDCCTECGVHHGTPCEECGGKAFHTPTCSEMNEPSEGRVRE